jgi:hypothetical protein
MTAKSIEDRNALLALLALDAREIERGRWQDADDFFADVDQAERVAEEARSPLLGQGQRAPIERDESYFAHRLGAARIWVRPGWMPLVVQARRKLLAIDVQLLEAREKLGTLRLHVAAVHTRRPVVRDIVETAAALAQTTCDVCGASGRRHTHGALRVRCAKHSDLVL